MATYRRAILAGAALTAAGVALACGNLSGRVEPASVRVEPVLRTTTCAELLSSGWAAPDDAEPSVSWDAATGEATIELTNTVALSLNVYAPECPEVDLVGPIIARMIRDDALAKAQECTDAVAMILRGDVPRKGDLVGDAEALRRHVTSYCPAAFDQQLRDAGR